MRGSPRLCAQHVHDTLGMGERGRPIHVEVDVRINTRPRRLPTILAQVPAHALNRERIMLAQVVRPIIKPPFHHFVMNFFLIKNFCHKLLTTNRLRPTLAMFSVSTSTAVRQTRKCCDAAEFLDIVTCTTSTIAHLRLTHCMSVRLASDTDKCVACLTRQQTMPTVQ